MNNAEKKTKKMREHYEELKAKIMKEQEENKTKRTKFSDVDSQNVFAEWWLSISITDFTHSGSSKFYLWSF